MDRRHQPRPPRDDRRRPLPQRPVPPPRRLPRRPPPPPRPPRGPRTLAARLLARACTDLGRRPLGLSPDARALLHRALLHRALLHHARWPGNVRELANAFERAAILADGNAVTARDLTIPGWSDSTATATPSPAATTTTHTPTASSPRLLVDLERDAIESALRHFAGNRTRAAEALGIGVRTLYDNLKRYGLDD